MKFRILSLDGGGLRGLATLLILQEIAGKISNIYITFSSICNNLIGKIKY